MGNDARKWLPLVMIAATVATTAFAVRNLPPTVTVDLRGLLPFSLEPGGDVGPKWVAIVGLPAIAALVWGLFQLGRGRAGLRLAHFLYRDLPDTLADPATVERFRSSYDTIGFWIVMLVLGVHAGMIAAALGHQTLAPRVITVILGISLVGAGNVMPRLRPNLLAGVRTRATLTDPQLWRSTHRVLGAGFVLAGLITAIMGLLVPQYGLAAAVVTLLTACVVATIAGASRVGPSAYVKE
jgi:hypothetical protein